MGKCRSDLSSFMCVPLFDHYVRSSDVHALVIFPFQICLGNVYSILVAHPYVIDASSKGILKNDWPKHISRKT